MDISEEMVKKIIIEVLQQMQGEGQAGTAQEEDVPALQFSEIGEAKPGTERNEIVIGVPPSFGTVMTKTMNHIDRIMAYALSNFRFNFIAHDTILVFKINVFIVSYVPIPGNFFINPDFIFFFQINQ